jgi:hypothetical protein
MAGTAPLPSSFDDDAEYYEESRLAKLGRRLKEEPLIPFGCALTVWALIGASKSIRARDSNTANKMFRRRIYAQGFTIAAMLVGSIYWKSDREKRKEWEKLHGEKVAKDKHERWLAELEAREEEDKAIRARRQRMMTKREADVADEKTVSVTEAVKELVDGSKK